MEFWRKPKIESGKTAAGKEAEMSRDTTKLPGIRLFARKGAPANGISTHKRNEPAFEAGDLAHRLSIRLASFAGAFAFVGGTAIACPFNDAAASIDDASSLVPPGVSDVVGLVASAAVPLPE